MPDGFDRNLVDPDDVIEQRRSALFGRCVVASRQLWIEDMGLLKLVIFSVLNGGFCE